MTTLALRRRDTVTAPAAAAPRSLLLEGIRWPTYEALLADLRERRLRLTYDRGRLEIMAPTFNHERSKRQIGRLVETLAEEEDVEILSGGSTTFRRADLERGLEPDDCFYIANIGLVLDKEEIDLRVDPPPDLALEIDVTSCSLDRMGIYAKLLIPEVWRFDGHDLYVYRLAKKGGYRRAGRSASFPKLDLKRSAAFIRANIGLGHNSLVKEFRKWLRAA